MSYTPRRRTHARRAVRALTATLGALALAVAVAACSTGPARTAAAPAASTGVDATAFPVTVEHVFGTTTIAKPPTRVATTSWVNADTALALGVVPVGMIKDDFGGGPDGSTPWKDARLAELGAPIGSPKAPAQYSETDGVDVTAIAKTAPDLILAAYSGITKEQYDQLSKIAPVVAYPDLPYGTPWQTSTRLIGQALGRSAQAEQLVQTTERRIADAAAKYPALKGRTFIYGNVDPAKGEIGLYTANDNRPRFLEELGMRMAPSVAPTLLGSKAFFVPWSAERADELRADVFLTWVADDAAARKIATDPLLRQIPAVRQGTLVVDSDNTLTLAISAANPLSIPWALDKLLPKVAAAAAKA